MKTNKILLIGPFPEPITGMSLANKILLDALIKKGYKVDFINTSLYSFEESVGRFSFKKLLFFLKFNIYLYKIFRVNTIYITPGSTFFGIAKYFLFLVLSSLFNKRIIVHIHTNNLQLEYKNSSGPKKAIMKYLLKKATFGIVLAPSLKKNLTPFLPDDKIFVVNNFVENYIISSKKTIENKRIDNLKIAFLSNLMTQKGIYLLLEALKNLEVEDKLNFEIKLAGYMDQNVEKDILNKINTIKSASYLGVVRGNDKKALLEWSNVFIFPSYLTEGLPLSILEAFATGNYVISTKHPSLVDFFDEKSIHFIEKKSANAIKKAVLEIPDRYSKKIILENYETVTKNFTVDNFSSSIIEIMNKSFFI